MIHDPRFPQAAGQRTDALTQTMDLMPTLLGLHDGPAPPEARSHDLANMLAQPAAAGRDVAVFGVFGGPIGMTDGRHVLYDLVDDPDQNRPIDAPDIAARLRAQAIVVLQDHDTPEEVYRWYGLDVSTQTKKREELHDTV